VSTVTVDALTATYGLIPDLVKLDVEGAEYLVLQGATALAQKQMTRFFVEMHSSAQLPMVENTQKVLGWCREQGYRAWYMKEKIELTDPAQVASRGRCHLLLLPEKMALPARLLPLEQGAVLEKVQLRS
jgi:hypothetical protein